MGVLRPWQPYQHIMLSSSSADFFWHERNGGGGWSEAHFCCSVLALGQALLFFYCIGLSNGKK
jgi:hypothetical protein